MSDIFISYARQDKAIVKKLAAVFEEQGWSVFWDAHIRTGETFDTVIEQELNATHCVVVL